MSIIIAKEESVWVPLGAEFTVCGRLRLLCKAIELASHVHSGLWICMRDKSGDIGTCLCSVVRCGNGGY